MLNSIHNDLIKDFEGFSNRLGYVEPAQDKVWINLGDEAVLSLKFMQYTKDPNHSMFDHLCAIGNMFSNPRIAGVDLTDEQQVLVVIRSLLDP